MAKVTIHEDDDYKVTYTDTPAVRDAVFARVLKYYKANKQYSGEGIHQDDECLISAPNVLSDITELIVKFKYHDKEN